MQVAVKTIVFHGQDEAAPAQPGGPHRTALERAIAEGSITLSLSHPNVVATYYHDVKPLRMANELEHGNAVPVYSDGQDKVRLLACCQRDKVAGLTKLLQCHARQHVHWLAKLLQD